MRPRRSATKALVYTIGNLVFTGDSVGIGKVESHNSTTCQVRLLYSIAKQEIRTYAQTALRPAILTPQTRVYIQHSDDSWLVGRVVDRYAEDDAVTYDVMFPNGKFARVPESVVFVRCYGPLQDPTEVLAWNGMETQFFHDRRLDAMRALLDARAASRGLTGLLSSSIELVPHQIEVVRRVLGDPIQRYLLADEVGMGKTIEAGAIIRQCLLEHPQARVLILVPKALLGQWEHELTSKFHIDDFPAAVEILPFEDLTIQGLDACDLLVIDEAHHLITRELNGAATTKGRASYHRLARLAHASKRLLLLSATPIIGNEEATLALLHLLDPSVYRLEDHDAFRQKLERRQEYGRLLLTLVPGAAPFARRITAGKLKQTFPDDPEVAKWADQLLPTEAPDDRERADRATRAVRQHIAETYRLHQRLIRSRRKETQGWELRPRSGRLIVDVDLDERIPVVCDALEEWRYHANHSDISAVAEDGESLAQDATTSREIALARRYARLVEALGISLDDLEAEWQRQRQAVRVGLEPTFPEEDDLESVFASAFAGDAGEENHAELAAEAIALSVQAAWRTHADTAKVVAFTSSTSFGREVHGRLTSKFGKNAVCAIFEGDTRDETNRAVECFTSSSRASIMLCDQSGEEGFNFHFAHSIVHLDLPLDPARIEQRIGRVDRFGRTYDSINQRVILPTDEESSPWAIWLDVLTHGFQVFRESVSEVQFLLEELAAEVVLTLFRSGSHASAHLTNLVHKQLSEERVRLDEQYALDRLDVREGAVAALSPDLQAFEANALAFGHALDGWIQGVLRFDDWHVDLAQHVFKIVWSRHTLVPKEPWYPWFVDSLEEPSSYLRTTAIAKSHVHLLRPGAPFVDTLERYLRWDDRGTAFATWRVASEWAANYGSEWLGFRLCYVVEADMQRQLAHDYGLDDETAIVVANVQRRADAFLPPTLTVLHLDIGFTEVTDPSLLEILTHPYITHNKEEAGYRDYNLGSRHDALDALISHTDFVKLCRQARIRSEELLRASASFKMIVESATRRVQTELWMRNERLRQRAVAASREELLQDTEIEREIAVNDAIIAAVANPTVRLDAIGIFVVAGKAPQEDA